MLTGPAGGASGAGAGAAGGSVVPHAVSTTASSRASNPARAAGTARRGRPGSVRPGSVRPCWALLDSAVLDSAGIRVLPRWSSGGPDGAGAVPADRTGAHGARARVVVHLDADAVDLTEQRGVQHLGGRSVPADAALVEQDPARRRRRRPGPGRAARARGRRRAASASSRTSSSISTWKRRSRSFVGSSSSTTPVSWARQQASQTRWSCRRRAGRPGGRPGPPMRVKAIAWAIAVAPPGSPSRQRPRCGCRPNPTTSRTDRPRGWAALRQQRHLAGELAGAQGERVDPLGAGLQRQLARGSRCSRASARSSVDFPLPLGPTSAVTRPARSRDVGAVDHGAVVVAQLQPDAVQAVRRGARRPLAAAVIGARLVTSGFGAGVAVDRGCQLRDQPVEQVRDAQRRDEG